MSAVKQEACDWSILAYLSKIQQLKKRSKFKKKTKNKIGEIDYLI